MSNPSSISDPADTLAAHVMLDPYVQEKLFKSLAEALQHMSVDTPQGRDGSAINEFITALFLHPVFQGLLAVEFKKLKLVAEPDYSGTYTTNKIVLRYSDNTGS